MSYVLNRLVEANPTYDGFQTFHSSMLHYYKIKNAVNRNDWDTCLNLSKEGLLESYSHYREIMNSLLIDNRNISNFSVELIQFFKEKVSDKSVAKLVFSKAKQEVLKRNPKVKQYIIKGLDLLSKGKVESNPLINKINGFSNFSINTYDLGKQSIVAIATKSLLGKVHSLFNCRLKDLYDKNFSTNLSRDLLDNLEEKISEFEISLEQDLFRIFSKCLENSNATADVDHFMKRIEDCLPSFARVQAFSYYFMIQLFDAKKYSEAKRIGILNARAFDLTREAVTSYAAALNLSIETNLKHSNIADLFKNIDLMQYSYRIPNGKNIELSKITTLEEGDFVEVSGFISAIRVGKDKHGKLISVLKLVDPIGKKSVNLYCIYVHATHIGLSKGSFVVINGFIRKGKKLDKGNTVIEIDKLKLSRLKKSSWKLTFLDSVDHYIDRWPGNLNIKYSLTPHTTLQKKDKKFGANEIIYKPLMKR